MEQPDLMEDLAIPYYIELSTIEASRRLAAACAEYPELPGCIAEAPNALDAVALADELRVRMIVAMHRRGERPPRPRPPLRSGISTTGAGDIDQFLATLFQEPSGS